MKEANRDKLKKLIKQLNNIWAEILWKNRYWQKLDFIWYYILVFIP